MQDRKINPYLSAGKRTTAAEALERSRPTASLVRRDDAHKPVSARQVAIDLPKRAWRRVTWREGSNGPLSSRFAAVRLRPGHRDYWRSTPRAPRSGC
jgi:SRSO17 transposase